MQEEKQKMTKEEYKKLVKKGRTFLMTYLLDIGDGAFSSEEKKKYLFLVICEEYKRLMMEDESFFREVEAFCAERRFKHEKEIFCKRIVSRMVSSGEVHRRYAKKTEEVPSLPVYEVPERYRK